MPSLFTTPGNVVDGRVTVRCPACNESQVLELLAGPGHVDLVTEAGTQYLTTTVAAMGRHVCAHVHHFVPKPTGKTSHGEPTYVLRCECGARQGEQ